MFWVWVDGRELSVPESAQGDGTGRVRRDRPAVVGSGLPGSDAGDRPGQRPSKRE